jgi:hypothetical protein
MDFLKAVAMEAVVVLPFVAVMGLLYYSVRRK